MSSLRLTKSKVRDKMRSMAERFTIREATRDDIATLAAIYTSTVQQLGPQRYTPEQVAAWAASPRDAERFEAFVMRPRTFIAVHDDEAVGFSGYEPDGHLASLYVAGTWTRQGVGSLLLQAVIDAATRDAIDELYTEASQFSRPLFERFGFRVRETQHVSFNDVMFERWKMTKKLSPSKDTAT